jgi:hypothetical protein
LALRFHTGMVETARCAVPDIAARCPYHDQLSMQKRLLF